MAFKLQPNQKMLFIGDSITDAGRMVPAHTPYGTGYMPMVRNFIIARYPELNLTFENRGCSGHTVRHLKARWERDVIAEKPQVLSVMIGINDCWRFFDNRPNDAVPVDEYEATYRELLTQTRQAIAPELLLLAEPYVIEANAQEPMRSMMQKYVAVVGRLAKEFGAVRVPIQSVFDEAMKLQPQEFWAADRIHPYPFGHALIARAFLKALGWEL